MRISDDRYSRDRQRYELAWRLIRHEARTSTIVRWTGLSQYQVRRMFRGYGRRGGARDVYRLRGIPPHVLTFFWRSQEIYSEAVVLAGLCRELGVFPTEPLIDVERDFPSLERCERLCVAYEAFKAHFPKSQISVEYAVLLATGLAVGEEVVSGHCALCARLVILDLYAAHPDRCLECRPHAARTAARRTMATPMEPPSVPQSQDLPIEMTQQSLF